MVSADKPKDYNDLLFRIVISLVAAHTIVTFGARQSLFLLLISWFYYRDLLLSFIIAFALVSEVYWVVVKLDKHYDWKNDTVVRIGLQVFLGIIIPCISAFLLAALYFSAFGINILNTLYLKFDYPVIVIMILTLNVYYLAFYFYRQWQYMESKALQPAFKKAENQKGIAVFVVQQGAKNIPLSVDTICYFYHEGDYNFVRTCDKEDFIVSQPLDELQEQLSDRQFFRVNRQMIVNFTACLHYEPAEFGKLKLIVTPETKEPVIISQKKAKAFKDWIDR